jgi:hypothetical protein
MNEIRVTVGVGAAGRKFQASTAARAAAADATAAIEAADRHRALRNEDTLV